MMKYNKEKSDLEKTISTYNEYKQVLDETMLNKWASAEEIAEWTYFVAVMNKSMTYLQNMK